MLSVILPRDICDFVMIRYITDRVMTKRDRQLRNLSADWRGTRELYGEANLTSKPLSKKQPNCDSAFHVGMFLPRFK